MSFVFTFFKERSELIKFKLKNALSIEQLNSFRLRTSNFRPKNLNIKKLTISPLTRLILSNFAI
jgi:hypothetical protein